MLSVLMLAVQLTTAQSPAELQARQRQWLVQGFGDIITQLDAMARQARSAPEKARRPVLGLVMEVKELGGTPPWRAIMVTGVLPGSAADRAGIKSGDRISAVGSRWLDRHTGIAAALYMADHTGPVPLVIQRDGKLRSVTLRRKREPCIAAAYRTPGETLWRKRIGSLRTMTVAYRAELSTFTTPEGLAMGEENLFSAFQLLIMMTQLHERELDAAVTASCGVGFRD